MSRPMTGLTPTANRPAADFAASAEAAGGRVKFAYLSVDFANPTGETLARAAREAVIDLADDAGHRGGRRCRLSDPAL